MIKRLYYSNQAYSWLLIFRVNNLIILFVFLCFFSCNVDKSQPEQDPVRIIFDTDMGSDCDDAGALALLHTYAGQGKAEILACIYSSGKVPYGAGVVEAINIYYGRGEIPVGATYDNEVGDPVDKMTAEKLARDTAAFHNAIIHNRDAEEQTRLNRKILASSVDGSITYVTVGHTKGLYDLLVSEPDDISPLSGYDLVRNKISRWVALGALGAANKEGNYSKDWNFFFNQTAPYTKYLTENFPCPIYYVDGGSNAMTGKSLKTTSPGNIVRTAYRDWLWNYSQKTLDDQRPSWDLATVFYAVEGRGDFMENRGEGWLEFDLEKGCRWHDGRKEDRPVQYYIHQKEGTDQAFSAYLNKMISKSPTGN